MFPTRMMGIQHGFVAWVLLKYFFRHRQLQTVVGTGSIMSSGQQQFKLLCVQPNNGSLKQCQAYSDPLNISIQTFEIGFSVLSWKQHWRQLRKHSSLQKKYVHIIHQNIFIDQLSFWLCAYFKKFIKNVAWYILFRDYIIIYIIYMQGEWSYILIMRFRKRLKVIKMFFIF